MTDIIITNLKKIEKIKCQFSKWLVICSNYSPNKILNLIFNIYEFNILSSISIKNTIKKRKRIKSDSKAWIVRLPTKQALSKSFGNNTASWLSAKGREPYACLHRLLEQNIQNPIKFPSAVKTNFMSFFFFHLGGRRVLFKKNKKERETSLICN